MATTIDRRILPAAQAVLIDRAGRATTPFYDFLRRLLDIALLSPEQIAELEELLALIDAGGLLPSTTNVVGAQSIDSTGTLAAGLVTLNFVNDTSDQKGTWYYGSNAAAQKGWHRFYTALAAGAGIQIRNSGLNELGELNNAADLPPVGNLGEAYWVRGIFTQAEMGLWFWDGSAWQLDPNASGIVSFEVANGDYGDITVSDDGATWMINPDVVTDEKLRDSAALSVIGRSADTPGDPADIVAAADKAVLHLDGNTLSFTPIDNSYISDFVEAAQDAVGAILADSATIDFTYDDVANTITAIVIDNSITDAKLRQGAAVSVIGRSANSTGNVADIAAGANDRILRRVGDALDFGQLTIGMAPDDLWTYAKLQNVSAASRLLGRGDSGAGDVEEITLGSGLTMTGTTLSASGGGGATVLSAFKPSDTSRNNTTATSADPDLTFSAVPAGTYVVEGFIFFVSAANPDLQFSLGASASVAVGRYGVIVEGHSIGLTAGNCNSDSFRTAAGGNNFPADGVNDNCLIIRGTLVLSNSTTDIYAQWAQASSDAANTTLRQGSWLRLTQLS